MSLKRRLRKLEKHFKRKDAINAIYLQHLAEQERRDQKWRNWAECLLIMSYEDATNEVFGDDQEFCEMLNYYKEVILEAVTINAKYRRAQMLAKKSNPSSKSNDVCAHS